MASKPIQGSFSHVYGVAQASAGQGVSKAPAENYALFEPQLPCSCLVGHLVVKLAAGLVNATISLHLLANGSIGPLVDADRPLQELINDQGFVELVGVASLPATAFNLNPPGPEFVRPCPQEVRV